MTSCILGVDIGTTTVKGVVFDQQGRTIHTALEEYPIYYPARFQVEQDPMDWWVAFIRIANKIMERCIAQDIHILAVGVSSQAPVFVPMDHEGNALGRALIWMDRRADQEARIMNHTIGEQQIINYSLNKADSFYLAAKLLWYKKHNPKRYDSMYTLLQANGYINFQLTGQYSMDEAHASLTQLYDMNTKTWAEDILSSLQLRTALLPTVYPCSTVIGTITKDASRQTHLPEGIPVIAGTVDGVAAALEAGVIEPGIAIEMSGTSSVLMMSSHCVNPTPELITMKHAIGGQILKLAAMSSTGASLRWFRDQFYKSELPDTYDVMNEEASQAKPHNELIFLPYMVGERSPIWDSDARGVFFGMSLQTTQGDLIRAMMEGAAFALRHNMEFLEHANEMATTFRLLGGQTKSHVWNQIKADVLNREVEVLQGSAGAPLGVAILAGMAVHFYKDVELNFHHDAATKQTYKPSAQMVPFYQKKYAIYKQLYEQTKDQFRMISTILEEEAR
jgi:xylulokinase